MVLFFILFTLFIGSVSYVLFETVMHFFKYMAANEVLCWDGNHDFDAMMYSANLEYKDILEDSAPVICILGVTSLLAYINMLI